MSEINYRQEIQRLAGPVTIGETLESRIAAAAKKLGLKFRTARRLYYQETTDPKASVHLKFEALLPRQDAVQELAARLSALEQQASSLSNGRRA